MTPNEAIISDIRFADPEAQFLYLGSARGYETRIPERLQVPFRSVPCAPFCSPRRVWRFSRMLVRICLGVVVAGWAMVRFRPHVVVASGGYVSVPVVLAAWILRRRIYLHEQNVHPGFANRVLSRLATRVGVSFRETLAEFPKDRTVLAGYPMRRQIKAGSRERALAALQIPSHKKVAFIVGGSMGSRAINRGTVEALKSLLSNDDIAVVHSTGLSSTAEYHAFTDTQSRLRGAGLDTVLPGRYVCRNFFHDIEDVYAVADLVVARAGAGTIMELAAVGKPSLLIPKSDVPGDHQLQNAMSLERIGSAEVLFEERGEENGAPIIRVRGDALAKRITDIMSSDETLARMGSNARSLLVDDALRIHVNLILDLAEVDRPLVETRRETDLVGRLVDRHGQTLELPFRSNLVGSGFLPDIPIESNGRAIILRSRTTSGSAFEVIRRSGAVSVNGQVVPRRHALEPGDILRIGEDSFQFATENQEVERPVSTGGMSLRIAVTSLGTLASRICGFFRDVVLGWVFGLGNTMDLMAVGLQVSNYFRGIFAEQAVDSAFLPTFLHLQKTGRRKEANELFSTVLTSTVIVSGAVTLVAMLTLPMWLPWIAGGFDQRGILDDAVMLTRVMFPYLVLISVAAVLSAVLKGCDRFAVPAFSSVMFSVGVLVGVCFYPLMGLSALGMGVLLGGVGQILIQIPALRSTDVRHGFGIQPRWEARWRSRGFRKVARATPNIVGEVSVQKAGAMVDTVLATSMVAGGVSALYFAMLIFRLPFGLISQSVNTVVLKELSDGQALRDRDWTRRLLADGINWTVFALLPLSVGMMVLSEPIVAFFFRFGLFDQQAVLDVASALRWYSAGLLGWGLTGLLGRFFAARMEQGTNTATSAAALIINIAVSISLVRHGLGIAGLAIGTSVAFTVSAVVRLLMLNRCLRQEGVALRRPDVFPSVIKTCLASVGATLALFVANEAVCGVSTATFWGRAFVLSVPTAFGLFAFFSTAFVLRSEQLEHILLRFTRRRSASGPTKEAGAVNPFCMDPPSRLLAWVQRNPSAAAHHNLVRRAASFLAHRDWRVRNVGVKLVGLQKFHALRSELLQIIQCRDPAPLSHRLLGGDFAQPGFLRRNAIQAIQDLGESDENVERALIDALDDPYYEVQVSAANALAFFADRLSGPGHEEALVRVQARTRTKNFEVASSAVAALGHLGLDDGSVNVLKRLHYHRNWKVRDRVVEAYGRLYERRIITDRNRILALLDDVLTTSEGFVPRFQLKERMVQLQNRLLEDAEGSR